MGIREIGANDIERVSNVTRVSGVLTKQKWFPDGNTEIRIHSRLCRFKRSVCPQKGIVWWSDWRATLKSFERGEYLSLFLSLGQREICSSIFTKFIQKRVHLVRTCIIYVKIVQATDISKISLIKQNNRDDTKKVSRSRFVELKLYRSMRQREIARAKVSCDTFTYRATDAATTAPQSRGSNREQVSSLSLTETDKRRHSTVAKIRWLSNLLICSVSKIIIMFFVIKETLEI